MAGNFPRVIIIIIVVDFQMIVFMHYCLLSLVDVTGYELYGTEKQQIKMNSGFII